MIERRRGPNPRTLKRDQKIIELYFGIGGIDPQPAKQIRVELNLSSTWIVYRAIRRARVVSCPVST